MPPLEAAIAGNKVIGYVGGGGKEYWKKPIFEEIQTGNIKQFCEKIINIVDNFPKAWNKKTFGFEIIDTPSKNAKALRREVSFRNDSLMGFVILRLRLEEMILNYYFLSNFEPLIKHLIHCLRYQF